MYKLIRNVHRYSALFLALLVAMYAITGFVIYRPHWFPDNQVASDRSEDITWERPDFQQDTVVVETALISQAERIRDSLGINARYQSIRKEHAESYTLVYQKPGLEERVTIDAGKDELAVTSVRHGTAGTAMRLHKLTHFNGGPLYFLWGALLDLTAIAIIVFAVSGVLLWHKLKATRRRIGWILLCSSTAYSLGSIVYLMI